MIGCTAGERHALAAAATVAILRNNRLAAPGEADLRYEEELPGRVLTLFTTQ